MTRAVARSPKSRGALAVAVASGMAMLFAAVWFIGARSIERGDAYALATAYAAASDDVRARVGPVASTALAPGESKCLSETAIPPAGDATFTPLVTGAHAHVKLDVRASRDAAGWHLVDAKVRPSDDAPPAVASGCTSGPAWGPPGTYGKG